MAYDFNKEKEEVNKAMGTDNAREWAKAQIEQGKVNSAKQVQETLKERNSTHGDFEKNAQASQELKNVIRRNTRVLFHTSAIQEALDMICFKISRIITGNPAQIDHWHDIAGYATLVENELRKKNEQSKS